MTIGEVAKESGLAASAIHFYEKAGLLPKPGRIGGRRHYDSSILERLAVLDRAKTCGFSLTEIRQLFYGFRATATPSERWQAMARRKIIELDDMGTQDCATKELLERSCTVGTSASAGSESLRKSKRRPAPRNGYLPANL